MNKQYISYLRVSTQKQGAEGLGISAQRSMCEQFARSNGGEIVKEFIDVESGKSRTRAELWQAIEYAKANNVPLVIAKLDRLARDVEFTFKVLNLGVEIHFCDMPVVNTMILGVFASVAQYERELISTRTKAALQAKVDRGGWVSKSGRWCTSLGREKGADMSSAYEASAKLRTDERVAWLESSPAVRLARKRHGEGVARKDILEELGELWELDNKAWGTRTGGRVTAAHLCKYLKS